MARKFAKSFYNSTAWKNARSDYIRSRMLIDSGLCELCCEEMGTEVHHRVFLTPENIDDPNITLNPENFELLCFDCHKLRHKAARRIKALAQKARNSQRNLGSGYHVDSDGNVQPFKCFLVWGAPGSGKTTYVREHKGADDVVVDLDLIGRALSMANKTDVPRNVERIAYDIRDFLYQQIRDKKLNAPNAWVIAGVPSRKQRQELAKQLDAETVFVEADFRTCYQHVLHDEERQDKALQLAIIDKWFAAFEQD